MAPRRGNSIYGERNIMNKLKTIALAVVVSAGLAIAQSPQANQNNSAPNSQGQTQNQTAPAGANPAGQAGTAGTANMPKTASPLELMALLGIGGIGLGSALRRRQVTE